MSGTGRGEDQMPSLKDKTVLIVGRGSGIARAIATAVSEDGGRVIVAGRHPDDLAAAYRGVDMGIEQVDVTATARKPTPGMLAVGTADDIASVALAVLTNGYLTGASIPVDGGE